MSPPEEWTLERIFLTPNCTIGELRGPDGQFVCHTLEDTFRKDAAKVPGKTCIPTGRYQVVINRSPRFSALAGKDVLMPLLLDVPKFSGVRIHSGLTPEDTLGCILTGQWAGKHERLEAGSSRAAYQRVFDLLRKPLLGGPSERRLVFLTVRVA